MKWLMQNAKQRAVFAMKNPRYALGAMPRELTLEDEKFVGKITGTSVEAICGYLDEPINSPAFARHLRDAEQKFRELATSSPDLYAKKVLLPYAAVRALKPECVNRQRSFLRVHFASPAQESAKQATFHRAGRHCISAGRKRSRLVRA